jgi:hypothetical protein
VTGRSPWFWLGWVCLVGANLWLLPDSLIVIPTPIQLLLLASALLAFRQIDSGANGNPGSTT